MQPSVLYSCSRIIIFIATTPTRPLSGLSLYLQMVLLLLIFVLLRLCVLLFLLIAKHDYDCEFQELSVITYVMLCI